MSLPIFLLYISVVIIGFTISGLVGFGANVLALPILSLFFNIQSLVVIFATLSIANSIYRVIENWRGIQWKAFAKLISISLLGTATGLWLFHILPEDILKLALGCFVIAMAIYNLRNPAHKSNAEHSAFKIQESFKETIFYHSVLLAGGILQGAFVCGGPLYVIYCNHYYGHDRLAFRGMQFGIVFVNGLLILATNLYKHLYTTAILFQSTLGIFALFIAFWLSHILLKKINDRTLYQMIQIVLLISGISVTIQALLNILSF